MLNDTSGRLRAIATIATVLNTPKQYSHIHETLSRTDNKLTVWRPTQKTPDAAEIAVGFPA